MTDKENSENKKDKMKGKVDNGRERRERKEWVNTIMKLEYIETEKETVRKILKMITDRKSKNFNENYNRQKEW